MTTREIGQRFLDFFAEHGHLVLPASPLKPENDTSVLFTTAGMQQFKGYYLKPDTASAKRLATIQPCVRTSDIDEVGDATHATLFEMLGNFSFGYSAQEADPKGPYFKRETITLSWRFLTETLGVSPDRLTCTYFAGDHDIPVDAESKQLLLEITGLPDERVTGLSRADTFWGPTGSEGPCGPTVEFHIDGVEIWNNVFNEYYYQNEHYTKLDSQGVDTGMGLERLAVILQGKQNVYEIDCNQNLLSVLPNGGEERSRRIIIDHLKAVTFLLAENIFPSNKEQGYIVRRLLRRAIRESRRLQLNLATLQAVISAVITEYGEQYPLLAAKQMDIQAAVADEEQKFGASLERGLATLDRELTKQADLAELSFFLFESFGFPLEQTIEELHERQVACDVDKLSIDFAERMAAHQNISRAGLTEKFKGGLAGYSDQEIRYHTATHLLNAALKQVLGEHIFQKGSNITPERLRFDFSHPDKLTDQQKQTVEAHINAWIAADLPVNRLDMGLTEAKERGAIGVFEDKYGDRVSVYTIGRPGQSVSEELCGGPHVASTGMIGHFELSKEEASAAGVRRIKGIVTPPERPVEIAA